MASGGTTTPTRSPCSPTYLVLVIHHAEVDIINNTAASGNRSYNLNLTIPAKADTFFLGGANIPLGTALGPRTLHPVLDYR